jgi:hypothetical protein
MFRRIFSISHFQGNNSFVLSTVGACSREEARGPVSPTVFVAPIRTAHRSSMKVCPSDSIGVVLVFIGVHPGAWVMGIWGSCSPVVVFMRISVRGSMTQMMRGVDDNSPVEAIDFDLFVFRLDLS